MPGQKSFIENIRPGFYTDKYGMYIYSYTVILQLKGGRTTAMAVAGKVETFHHHMQVLNMTIHIIFLLSD